MHDWRQQGRSTKSKPTSAALTGSTGISLAVTPVEALRIGGSGVLSVESCSTTRSFDLVFRVLRTQFASPE